MKLIPLKVLQILVHDGQLFETVEKFYILLIEKPLLNTGGSDDYSMGLGFQGKTSIDITLHVLNVFPLLISSF